jgi:hypothetical protein
MDHLKCRQNAKRPRMIIIDFDRRINSSLDSSIKPLPADEYPGKIEKGIKVISHLEAGWMAGAGSLPRFPKIKGG